MPWIYNPLPHNQSTKAMDGSVLAFPARKKTYIKPELMSSYVWQLIRESKLANRGGDPQPRKPSPASAPRPVPKKVEAKEPAKEKPEPKPDDGGGSANTDTSSSHHRTRAKVASESLVRNSASKKSKAEKKQSDDSKKVDTQGNSKANIEADAAEKPKKRRKRTFKKKG